MENDGSFEAVNAALDAIEGPSGDDLGGSAGAGSPPAPEATAAPAADATGGGTPGSDEREPFIPRARFDEILAERDQARQQAEQLQALEGLAEYREVIPELQRLGYTAERIRAELQARQQAAAPAETPPEDQFAQWLAERGVEAWDTDPDRLELLRDHFELQREREAFRQETDALRQAREAQEREAREAAEAAAFDRDLQGALQAFPAFQVPELQASLIGAFLAQQSQGVTLQQVAERLHGALQTFHRNQLSQSALSQANEAQRQPVTAGGGIPPITDDSWVMGSDEEFERGLMSELRATARSGA